MSNEPGRSPLESLWRAALMVAASVVLIWIAVQLIRQMVWWLVGIGAVVVIAIATVAIWRWWRSTKHW